MHTYMFKYAMKLLMNHTYKEIMVARICLRQFYNGDNKKGP